MNRKILSVLLAALMLLGILTGCEVVSEIAGNVADAAMAELESQVKATLETYKVEVIEVKTAVGKLNGSSGDIQFFCAALVCSASPDLPHACADTLSKVFDSAGVMTPEGNKISSPYLEHKDLSFKLDEFESGKDYYTIYVYKDKIIGIPSETK